MSTQIEIDLINLLEKIDKKIDNLSADTNNKFTKIEERLTKIEINQAEIKGYIKVLDTKIEGLDKRISNQELTNRGILIALIVAILGIVAKLFGLIGNP